MAASAVGRRFRPNSEAIEPIMLAVQDALALAGLRHTRCGDFQRSELCLRALCDHPQGGIPLALAFASVVSPTLKPPLQILTIGSSPDFV